MFSTYPDEWPGAGLLLLRGALGAVVIARGLSFLLGWHNVKFMAAAIALLAVGGGTLVVTGYLTRLGAGFVALASACGILFWSAIPTMDFFQSRLAASLVCVIAAALVCLGPGAFSFDARLFGRHEIVFPNTSSNK